MTTVRVCADPAWKPDPRGVIVDLGEVTFLDPTGIAALIAGQNKAKEIGWQQVSVSRSRRSGDLRLLPHQLSACDDFWADAYDTRAALRHLNPWPQHPG